MKQYSGRQADLGSRVNKHLKKLTRIEKDYFSELKIADYFELKSVLSDINNVLTLKMTLQAADWLCNYFKLISKEKRKIKDTIDKIKPNTNGYDIYITEPIKLIAEIKCINPYNNGDKYGAAQWHGILDDAVKLKEGKRHLPDTTTFYKFLFLADLGERTDKAIDELLRPSKSTGTKKANIAKHEIKKDIILVKEKNKVFTKNNIYIIKLKVK